MPTDVAIRRAHIESFIEHLEVRAKPEKRADIWRGLDEEFYGAEEHRDADEPS